MRPNGRIRGKKQSSIRVHLLLFALLLPKLCVFFDASRLALATR